MIAVRFDLHVGAMRRDRDLKTSTGSNKSRAVSHGGKAGDVGSYVGCATISHDGPQHTSNSSKNSDASTSTHPQSQTTSLVPSSHATFAAPARGTCTRLRYRRTGNCTSRCKFGCDPPLPPGQSRSHTWPAAKDD
jgi:hypothetical protein